MPVNLSLEASQLLGFLLVLARISGAMAFLPIPGSEAYPGPSRIVLSLAISVALLPRRPTVDAEGISTGWLAVSLFSEAALGITIGLAVAFLVEAFVLGAQMLSLHAGFGFITTIDPATQADTGLLPMIVKLAAGLMFFATGLDQQLLRAFASSLDTFPPGTFSVNVAMAYDLIRLSTQIFSLGLRLALPVLGLLLMIDIAIALLSRLNQQLQLLTLAFSLKLLLSLVTLAWLLLLFPGLYQRDAAQMMGAVWAILRR